jgi:hypothetical protein
LQRETVARNQREISSRLETIPTPNLKPGLSMTPTFYFL